MSVNEMNANPLSRERIFAVPGSRISPERILIFQEVPSTNTLAKEMAAKGAPHGTVLIADRQSAGRGRLGRSFLSPPDVGVYFSIILRPHCRPQELMHLTCAAAVAMCDAVEHSFGFRPGIKWTNDLVWNGKKLGGILTELALNAKTGLVDYAIVGVGINCRQTMDQLDPAIADMACSVRMITGQDADRNILVAQMIRAMDACSAALLSGRAQMLERYRAGCITLGREVSILRGDEILHGTALDIDPEGGLMVRLASGQEITVSSGEVSIRGLYGYI